MRAARWRTILAVNGHLLIGGFFKGDPTAAPPTRTTLA
jgi:hypothetical protein